MILNDRLSTRHAVDMEVNLILPGALYTRNISSPPCHRPTATGAGVKRAGQDEIHFHVHRVARWTWK